jgi:hypothetical protein
MCEAAKTLICIFSGLYTNGIRECVCDNSQDKQVVKTFHLVFGIS